MFSNLLESAPQNPNRIAKPFMLLGIGVLYLASFVLTAGYGIWKIQPKLNPPESIVSCFFVGEGFLKPPPKDPIPIPQLCELNPPGCGVLASDEETDRWEKYGTYFSTVCNKVMPRFPTVLPGNQPQPKVWVEIQVDPNGKIVFADFKQGDPNFQSAVQAAISQWTFKSFEPTPEVRILKGALEFSFDLQTKRVEVKSGLIGPRFE